MSWRDAIGVLKDVLPQDMKSEEILWCNRSGWSYDDYRAMKRLGVDPRDYESPITAFEAVLMSDEVVEAAAKAMHQAPGEPRALTWESLRRGTKRRYRDMARAALQAAAKGTEGSA